jgi:hypothetical protein
MRRLVALLTILLAPPLQAQWTSYATRGVPRTSSGAPNLQAPAPRTPDGKPDLSGIWEPERNRPCPPEGCFDMQVPQEFLNIGYSLKEGLPYQPWAAEARRQRMEQNGKDDPVSRCLPPSLIQLHTSPLLRKIVQTPELVIILSEFAVNFRQLFTDGRPAIVNPGAPSYTGFSTGKWEGDTLVVQTNGFKDGLWLDRNGSPLTDAARITERFRRVNYGRLEIEITVDDPKAYTAPWTIKLHQNIVLDTDLIDYVCLENEKDLSHLLGK